MHAQEVSLLVEVAGSLSGDQHLEQVGHEPQEDAEKGLQAGGVTVGGGQSSCICFWQVGWDKSAVPGLLSGQLCSQCRTGAACVFQQCILPVQMVCLGGSIMCMGAHAMSLLCGLGKLTLAHWQEHG